MSNVSESLSAKQGIGLNSGHVHPSSSSAVPSFLLWERNSGNTDNKKICFTKKKETLLQSQVKTPA